MNPSVIVSADGTVTTMDPSVTVTFVTLPSGQRVHALVGCSVAALSLIPSKGLRPAHFSASPIDVVGWETLAKSALQRSMIELQWVQVTAERDLRRAAAVEASAAAAVTAASSSVSALPSALSSVVVVSSTVVDVTPRTISRKRPRSERSPDAPTLIVDCAYNHLMSPGEGASLGTQLMHSYAAVRRRAAKVRLALSGVADARLAQLSRVSGAAQWRVHVTRDPLELLFIMARSGAGGQVGIESETVTVTSSESPLAPQAPYSGIGADERPVLQKNLTTYLTADAETVLWRFELGEAYVIGGVVDRNRHPGVAAARAAALGLRTARFPLHECGAPETSAAAAAGTLRRRVLTTNKAVDLCAAVIEGHLLAVVAGGEGDDAKVWREAVSLVLGVGEGAGAAAFDWGGGGRGLPLETSAEDL